LSTLYLLGIGPGSQDHLTAAAKKALAESEFVVGYTRYIKQIENLLNGKEVYATGMRKERERAAHALEQARRGRTGSIVSSGDPCIYGAGGLLLEMATEDDFNLDLKITIIPGITAALSAGSLLGAPLMNDYVSISLSDLLTDRETIINRLHSAGKGDFVLALYNPRSTKRREIFLSMIDIMLQYRKADTPVGVVTSAYREEQEVIITSLARLAEMEEKISMNSIIIIGNSQTYTKGGYMITPRGYS